MEFIKTFPWTAILSVLIAIISIVFKNVFDTHVVPFLERKGLTEAAVVAVNAAEAIYGRHKGEEKMKYALDTLKRDGWNVDSEVVVNAVKAAWQSLDLTQIAVGVKDGNDEIPPDVEPVETDMEIADPVEEDFDMVEAVSEVIE